MPILAGIDEAGYGPLLGPYVISATAFRVPEEHAEADLWDVLADAVARDRRSGRSRSVVADSKKVHRSAEGVGSLERHVLPFAAAVTPLPCRLRALAAAVGQATDGFDAYPWYCGTDPEVPRHSSATFLNQRAEALREAMMRSGCVLCAVRARILDVAEFNRAVAAHGNKASAVSHSLADLMLDLWEGFGEEGIFVAVDKQGGRDRYADFLAANLPFCRISTKAESSGLSEYLLSDGRRRMRVVFKPECDASHLPTALASMFSKYLREMFMGLLNDFWARRVPNLNPTAGYYDDGLRFLTEIESARQEAGAPVELLVRRR